MARESKAARTTALAAEVDRTVVQPLSRMLADAIELTPIGPAHGALAAIEGSLIDLKARARSVQQHLGAEHASILERLDAL